MCGVGGVYSKIYLHLISPMSTYYYRTLSLFGPSLPVTVNEHHDFVNSVNEHHDFVNSVRFPSYR